MYLIKVYFQANFVCTGLNYSGAANASSKQFINNGQNFTTIPYGKLYCAGNDSKLDRCRGSNYCNPGTAVYVICAGKGKMSLKVDICCYCFM